MKQVNEKSCSCKECPAEQELMKLKGRCRELEAENLHLKLELQEFRERYWLRRKKKEEDEESLDIPKKRGAPVGHPGWFRKRPKKATFIEEVRLDRCPHCGSKELSPCQEVAEHFQEDILLPAVVVTMYRKWFYGCRRCEKKVCGQGKMELPNSFIGPIAKSIAVWLKYDVKISDRDLKRLFQLFQLNMVPASLAGFRNQLCRKANGLYLALRQYLQKSAFAYVDETGWKVNGILHQLWSASNGQVSVFMIHKNRSLKALQELLGEPVSYTHLTLPTTPYV